MKRGAFTLAEVLITLGIIGVVAAMTLPSLISKYDKKVATTRLKKFYTSYLQAISLSDFENSSVEGADILLSGSSPDQMLDWYNRYLKSYLKTVKVAKTALGIEVKFLDGSGMLIAKDEGCATGTACTHILYCVDFKYCEEYKDKNRLYNHADGKNTFLFYSGINFVPAVLYEYEDNGSVTSISNFNREDVVKACKNHVRNCTRLLLIDNWEFKDDYPRW